MIADDLRAILDPGSPLGQILRHAEWVQAPFPVYPWVAETDPVEIRRGRSYVMDWRDDRVPERLVPTDGTGSVTIDRLAFPVMGIFHDREPGALLATELWARDDPDALRLLRRVMGSDDFNPTVSLIDGFLQCHLVGFSEAPRLANVQVFYYMIMRHQGAERADPYAPRFVLPVFMPIFDDACPEALVRQAVYAILTGNLAATCRSAGLPPPTTTDAQYDAMLAMNGGLRGVQREIQLDTTHTAVTVATVAALLNARNLPREVVTPTQSRPSRRRGEPPPFRFHVLKLDPARARSGSHGEGRGGADHTALHLRRGHWKIFSPTAPLLGRHVGRWWWASHLSGQADRLVEKTYEITDPKKEGAE